jgi:hypothetical protein
MQNVIHATWDHLAMARGGFVNSGPKGPPSAPPTVPPIIINPFNRHSPVSPAIDPRNNPPGPPIIPPRRPDLRM